jgi:hypothetical protein
MASTAQADPEYIRCAEVKAFSFKTEAQLHVFILATQKDNDIISEEAQKAEVGGFLIKEGTVVDHRIS